MKKTEIQILNDLSKSIANGAASLKAAELNGSKRKNGNVSTGISKQCADGLRRSLVVFYSKSGIADAYFSVLTEQPTEKGNRSRRYKKLDEEHSAFNEENYLWNKRQLLAEAIQIDEKHIRLTRKMLDAALPDPIPSPAFARATVVVYVKSHWEKVDQSIKVLKTPPAPSSADPEFDRLYRNRMARYALEYREQFSTSPVPGLLDPRRLPLRDLFEVFRYGIGIAQQIKARAELHLAAFRSDYFKENSLLTAHPGAMLSCVLLSGVQTKSPMERLAAAMKKISKKLADLGLDPDGAAAALSSGYSKLLDALSADDLKSLQEHPYSLGSRLGIISDYNLISGSGVTTAELLRGFDRGLPYADNVFVRCLGIVDPDTGETVYPSDEDEADIDLDAELAKLDDRDV